MTAVRIPRFGLYGTVGPAPGFTWGEARCRDGWLPSLPRLRLNIVRTGILLNELREGVARDYAVKPSRVYIVCNSWARSDRYNASLPGAASNSFHTQRRSGWRKRPGFLRWPNRAGAPWRRWRYYVGKGCSAVDVQVFVRRNDGKLVKVAPARVRSIALHYVAAYRKGGRGVYATFTHLDHRGYPSDWTG